MHPIIFARNKPVFPSLEEAGFSAENQGLKPTNSFALHGIAASVLLTTAYFTIVSIAESFDHAVTQFSSLAYLFVPLIASFGFQIALFSYARQLSKAAHQRSTSVTASGGMSTTSMILCCAHHLTDIAALVGLTSVTLFLTTYQPVFLLVGIVSNILGILTTLLFLQKSTLYNPRGFLAKPMGLNLAKLRKLAIIIGVAIVIVAFALVAASSQPNQQSPSSGNPSSNGGRFTLSSKVVNQNNLTIQATPQPFKYGEPVKISLVLDTHSGALNFDLTQMTTLQDSNGTTYAPTGWSGSPFSGHHVSGTLNFPALNGQPSAMQLILKNVNGADWTFEWTLSR